MYRVIFWGAISDTTYPEQFDMVQAAQWIAALWSIPNRDAGVYEVESPGIPHRTYTNGILRYARDAIGLRRENWS